jgi:hypothetical protein
VENHRLLRETISQQYSVFVQRYSRAFHHALPELGVEELAWRVHFAFSVMFNAFAGNDVLKIFTRSQIVSARDPDMIVKYLVPFVVAGLVSLSRVSRVNTRVNHNVCCCSSHRTAWCDGVLSRAGAGVDCRAGCLAGQPAICVWLPGFHHCLVCLHYWHLC